MVAGTFDELKNILGTDSFGKVAAFVEKVKSKELAANEWVSFDDTGSMKIIALDNSNYREGVKEFHKIYTDIHLTISGVDTVFTGKEITEVIEPYQDKADYSLVNSPTYSVHTIPPRHFILLAPDEIHSSMLSGEEPLKAVIKLKSV